jgi:hypothetical protein
LVFTASSFKRFQQSDLNKINQLRVRKIGSLLKYAANSGRRVNGNVADTQSQATAGLQKYRLISGTWVLQYILQDGLNIGVPYSIPWYPAALNPATGGCRNIAGRHNDDGTVTIFAITSTISANGDTGADPNKLVKVTDRVSDTTLSTGDDHLGHFWTIRSAQAREVFRGVALAPTDHDEW